MSNHSCEKYQEQLMALVDGALDETAQVALRSHIESCTACREEYAWIKTITAHLEALGDDITKKAPEADLVGPVMRAVARIRDTGANTVPPRPLPRPKRVLWAHWTTMAVAAAAAILVLYVAGYRISKEMRTPETPTQAFIPDTPGVSPESTRSPLQVARSDESGVDKPAPSNPQSPIPNPQSPIPDPPLVMAKVDQISLDDIFDMRKEYLTNPDARLQIGQWASLTEEEARDLAESAKASLNAKVGASKVLPSSEAQVILLAAVEADPNNPYLRHELANAYGAQPETAQQEAQQLEALRDLEPDNALAAYKVVANALGRGDVQSALVTLASALDLPELNLHTRESALCQEEALVENGVEPDAASLLTALTAGNAQYTDILELGNQLLQFGMDFEQQGNSEVAQVIYEAVHQLGTQVVDVSMFSIEQLAGLDVRRAALDVLEALYATLGQTQDAEAVNQLQAQLASSFEFYNDFTASVDTFFAEDTDPAFLSSAGSEILQNGDIAYFGGQVADAPAD